MSGNFHYTKSTVSARRWCKKCSTFTIHQVLGGKLAGCEECMEKQKLEAEARKQQQPKPEQGRLF